MPIAKINNINVYYEVHGQGEPLVFISGFITDHFSWGNIFKRFTDNFQVVLIDNRGTGKSDTPNYPYTVDMMADDVVGLCKHLNITKAYFIGTSLGAAIVQTIAYKYPEFVLSFALSCPFQKINSRLKLQVESFQELRKAKDLTSAVAKMALSTLYSLDFLHSDARVMQCVELIINDPHPVNDIGYKSQMHALFNFDSSAWLNKVKTPCYIIYADEDMIVDLDSSWAVIKALPEADSYCFENVGHVPHVEKPELFIKLLLDFFSQHKQ